MARRKESVKRKRKVLAAAAFLSILLVTSTNALVFAGSQPKTEASAAAAPVAVVLGAGVDENGRPSHVLEDRLTLALELYREHRVSRLIVSGDHRRAAYDEPNAMRRWLEDRGVPPAVIFMDHAGFDTYSTMWRAKHVFGAERVLVVTQKFHMPRALWLARGQGMDAEGVLADRRPYQRIAWFELREVFSRTKAFLDTKRSRTPQHAGPRIPLDGDGSQSTAG